MNEPADIRFSIVILTYARDAILAQTLERLYSLTNTRGDFEVILVDNNIERANREIMLQQFAHTNYLWNGRNDGVHARNDGMAAARGEYIILLDDDVLIETAEFLDIFADRFDTQSDLGAVTIAKYVRGETRARPDLIPHTRKDIDLTKAFQTFRFVGGCVGMRRQSIEQVGGFLPDFFYGLEEIELSYRIIDRGWRILYDPAIVAEELEHDSGRKPKREVQTRRLANKYIIDYLRMPMPEAIINVLLFTPYLLFRAGGEASVPGAIQQFFRWRRKAGRPKRKPISHTTAQYIRDCGGAVWR
jgi:GT2 family glycosyltransferase